MPDYYDELTVGGVKDRGQLVGLGAYWRDVRMAYTAGDLIYRGVHNVHNSATTDTDWEIWKYTWSGDDLIRMEGPLPGSWDGRAAVDWG